MERKLKWQGSQFSLTSESLNKILLSYIKRQILIGVRVKKRINHRQLREFNTMNKLFLIYLKLKNYHYINLHTMIFKLPS